MLFVQISNSNTSEDGESPKLDTENCLKAIFAVHSLNRQTIKKD